MSTQHRSRGRERRRHPRFATAMTARLVVGGHAIPCRVHNLSAGGALIDAVTSFRIGEAVVIEIEDLGALAARIVRVTSACIALAFEGEEARVARFIEDRRAERDGAPILPAAAT